MEVKAGVTTTCNTNTQGDTACDAVLQHADGTGVTWSAQDHMDW